MHKQLWLLVGVAGRAGMGVCVLVHPRHDGMSSLRQAHVAFQSLCMRFQGSMFGSDEDSFIASMYLAPIGNPHCRLRHHDLTFRLCHLRSSAMLAMQHGYNGFVLLGRDFNARVADLSDVSSS